MSSYTTAFASKMSKFSQQEIERILICQVRTRGAATAWDPGKSPKLRAGRVLDFPTLHFAVVHIFRHIA